MSSIPCEILHTHRVRVSGNGAGCGWGAGNHGADELRQRASGNNELHSVFGLLQDADGLLMCDRLIKCLSIDGKDLVSFLQSSISIKNEKGGKRYLMAPKTMTAFLAYSIRLL